MKTTKDIVSAGSRPGHSMNPDYITIHQTGNTSEGADAKAHARYLHNNAPNPSWHYSVDDKIAVQHLPLDENGWHAADGGGDGNMNSIGIEGCINSDGNYLQMIENMAKKTAELIHTGKVNKGFPEAVKQHHDWNNSRNCPAQIRAGKDGIGWDNFLDKVEKYLDEMSSGSLPEVRAKIAVKVGDKKLDIDGYLIDNVTHIPAVILEDLAEAEVLGHGDHITIELPEEEEPSVEKAIRILRQVVGLE